MASGHRRVPHKQAGHMAAPTSMHYHPKIPCQQGAVHTWLKTEVQPPEIDFRSTPNNGHSEAHAGLPLLTHSGHFRWGRQRVFPNKKSPP